MPILSSFGFFWAVWLLFVWSAPITIGNINIKDITILYARK